MSIIEITPDEVRQRRREGTTLLLLDVREPAEVEAWAYPDAMTIPLGLLEDRLNELPQDRLVVCACRSGGRSAAAAELLDRHGFSAANLVGGELEWQATEQDR